jgi:hypothetical protein
MATLCLEVYYRYLPMYGGWRSHGGMRYSATAAAPSRGGARAASGAAPSGTGAETGGEDVHSAPREVSDVPLGGTGVKGSLGVGGGGAGCYGFRSGGGRVRATLRFGGSRRSESAIDGGAAPARSAGHRKSDRTYSSTPTSKGATIASSTEEAAVESPDMTARGGRRAETASSPPPAPRLKGGSRDDNEEFEEYLRFRKEFREGYDGQFRTGNVVDVDVTERRAIAVLDSDGRPVPNASVRVLAGGRHLLRCRTYSSGRTFIFPRALGAAGEESFTVEADCSAGRSASEFAAREQGDWEVRVTGRRPERTPVLDLLLCLDTTGSMSDEIRAVRVTLKEIVRRIHALPGEVALRLGLVEYRDRGDEYVARVHDFTEDVDGFQSLLDAVRATGGGDYAESVNEALRRSVGEVSWTAGEEAVRLTVLVADAPPHMDYPDDVKYDVSMKAAHARAIKIYPIAASGLKKRGEYVFRQLAQYTSAKFLFITYGGGTPHDVKPFEENDLDDIVVGIVTDELAAFRGGPAAVADAADPGAPSTAPEEPLDEF